MSFPRDALRRRLLQNAPEAVAIRASRSLGGQLSVGVAKGQGARTKGARTAGPKASPPSRPMPAACSQRTTPPLQRPFQVRLVGRWKGIYKVASSSPCVTKRCSLCLLRLSFIEMLPQKVVNNAFHLF